MNNRFKITEEQVNLGADWLVSACPEQNVEYDISEVLDSFVTKALVVVYPRYKSLEGQRFTPSYYLTNLLEVIAKRDRFSFIPKFKKHTKRVMVKTTKRFGSRDVEYRFTYGLRSITLIPRDGAVTTPSVVEEDPNLIVLRELSKISETLKSLDARVSSLEDDYDD